MPVFYQTTLSLGIVNLKPLLPGRRFFLTLFTKFQSRPGADVQTYLYCLVVWSPGWPIYLSKRYPIYSEPSSWSDGSSKLHTRQTP
jgi:hypothetical protein